MRLLADQDVYKVTGDLIRSWGHDLVTASELGKATASDEELLALANAQNRIMVTRDKDFGALLFLGKQPSLGVILLRGKPSELNEVHKTLRQVLEEQKEETLTSGLCVVEPDRYRLRHI